jgi:hypothetical protein
VVVVVRDGSIVPGTWWATNSLGTAVSKKGARAPTPFPLQPDMWEDPAHVDARTLDK